MSIVQVDLIDGPLSGHGVEIHADALTAWGGEIELCLCGDPDLDSHDCAARARYALDGDGIVSRSDEPLRVRACWLEDA